jgi:hypothetical protein
MKRKWRWKFWKNTTTLLPRCYSDSRGPCFTHTFHLRYMPLWFARWFVKHFVISTCCRPF